MATDVGLLRAAQEVFTNIRKHLGEHGDGGLSPVECGVRLSVADNGIGLADGHADGFGLRGMRDAGGPGGRHDVGGADTRWRDDRDGRGPGITGLPTKSFWSMTIRSSERACAG